MTLAADATLKIEGGAVVKFAPGKSLDATEGRILAKGRPYDYIIFTSEYDDTVGGEVGSSSNSPASGDWEAIYLEGNESVFEFCKIAYAEKGICVNTSDTDIAVQHNIITTCDVGVEVELESLNSDTGGEVMLFNNLITCTTGICLDVYDPNYDDASVVKIFHNTIDDANTAIDYVFNSYIGGLVEIKNNLITDAITGIYWSTNEDSWPNEDYNAFDNCTAEISGFTPGSHDVRDSVLSSPYDTSMTILGSYFLNTNASGGELLKDAGDSFVLTYYDEPDKWSIYHLPDDSGEGDSRHYFSTTATITSSVTWAPNYDTIDSGRTAIGYHHPRTDYLLPDGLTFSSTSELQIKPGTVIALGDGVDSAVLATNGKLKCEGAPYGPGYVYFVYTPFLTSGWDATGTTAFATYRPEMVIDGSEDVSIGFTYFLELDQVEWDGSGNLDFYDNTLMRNESCGLYINDGGNNVNIFNCLFVFTEESGIITYDDISVDYCAFSANWTHGFHLCGSTSDNCSLTNCYFRCEINGIYHDVSSTYSSLSEQYNYFFQNSAYGVHRKNHSNTQLNLDSTDVAWYNRSSAQAADGSEIYYDWTYHDERYYWPQDTSVATSGINNGSDPCFPYIGYTTDPDHLIDDGINADPNDPNNASDIGYHYPMDIDADGDGLYLCQESQGRDQR